MIKPYLSTQHTLITHPSMEACYCLKMFYLKMYMIFFVNVYLVIVTSTYFKLFFFLLFHTDEETGFHTLLN